MTEVAGVRLSHPDKLLFPSAGITKEMLAAYHVAVAEKILPHLRGRPVSLVRCPDGEGGECFFQRHRGAGMPAAIRSVDIGDEAYMVIRDLQGLLGAVQMGTLELHVWGAREDTIERAERLVLDLDPDEGVGFADVRQAAFDLRGFLDELGLASFALLTGGKGIHVVAPLLRRYDWPVIKAFANGVAESMARREPARFTTNLRKAARTGKIFIDYLRNERASTAICPWSTRAHARAPVAMPVTWDELAGLGRSDAFTIADAVERVGTNAWRGYFELRQSITRKAAARLDAAG